MAYLIEFGILIGTYTGLKLLTHPYEKKQNPFSISRSIGDPSNRCLREAGLRVSGIRLPGSRKKPGNSVVRIPGTRSGSSRIKSRSKSESENKMVFIPSDELARKDEHYIKLSLLTMGVTSLSQIFSHPLKLPGIALYAYISRPLITSGVKSFFKKKKMGNQILISVATILGGVTGQFFALSTACFFYYLAGLLLRKTRDHSEKRILNLFDNQPRSVWLVREEVEIKVPLKQVTNDDIIAVNTGEVVPIDGIIINGMAMIDQSGLTGEFQPAEKQAGDKVFASTFVISGKIYVRVLQTGEDTAISQVEKILNQSIKFKPDIQSKGEEWADKSASLILLTGGLALPVLGASAAVVILRSSFGYSLGVLASLEMLRHLRNARTRGIFVKDGRALESLHQVDTVLFDKTGTLTKSHPEIGRIISSEKYDEHEILTYAAIAETRHTHPVAKAILKKARELSLNLDSAIPHDAKYYVGHGIEVRYGDKLIQAGSLKFMNMKKILIPTHIRQTTDSIQLEGNSVIMVAVNGQVVGGLEIKESIRSEVKSVIDGLRQHGIRHISIVSGDHRSPTQKIADELGMDSYHHDVLPEHKATIVKQLQNEGRRVLFVGDGVNDSVAMVQADVSVSLNGASAVAMDVAQIILLDENLSQLVNLFDISERLYSGLRRSLFFTMTPAVIIISGVLMGNMGIFSSVLMENMFFLTGLATTLLPSKTEKLNKKTEFLT